MLDKRAVVDFTQESSSDQQGQDSFVKWLLKILFIYVKCIEQILDTITNENLFVLFIQQILDYGSVTV